MQTDHPNDEARSGRTECHRRTEHWFTPLLVATTTSAAPTRAGMAYSPLLNTLGTCRISTSRTVPPPTPVTVPRMIACIGPAPNSSALPAPVTANRLNPAASSTSIELLNRLSRRLNKNAISPPAAATAK